MVGITSRPKARDGLRYPCPTERFIYGSLLGKQGFGPAGEIGVFWVVGVVVDNYALEVVILSHGAT